MDIKTKIQLDVLMEEFMWLQTIDEDGAVFDAKWRVFYASLSREDAKIAWQAWLDTIYENLSEIRKSVSKLPEGGDYTEIGKQLGKIAATPFLNQTAAVNA
jgi:hypothetical protein